MSNEAPSSEVDELRAQVRALRIELTKTKRERNALRDSAKAKAEKPKKVVRFPKGCPLDPGRLLTNAVAFHEAGARCHRGDAPAFFVARGDIHLGAPCVVCYAFAIELYLKLLSLLTRGRYDRGEHRLDILFSQLEDPLQLRIEQRYSGGYPLQDLDVLSELHDASNAFVKWRYVHEQRVLAISPETLAAIGKALHLTARELDPSLSTAFDPQ